MGIINSAQELGIHEHDDDDAFYAELERRVLTLIDDHDYKEFSSHTQKYSSSSLNTKRRYETVKHNSNYFYWNEGGCDSVPASILSLWGSNNKGTGVFIPRIAISRNKNKPRRKINNKGIVYKHDGS
ncbi:unnamed protein product [Lactuca virosa]|uniref:Uncharacterized protein n=1 Tax=Lactuca virosa TaxID=75947 RepID=A0AAU9N9H1_9ASTR|nr:unnamed protein product [Lactuca virosa]